MKNKKFIPYVLGSAAVVVLIVIGVLANNGRVFQGYLSYNIKNVRPTNNNLSINPNVIKYLSPEPSPAPKLVFKVASFPTSSTVKKGTTNVPLYGITVSYPSTAPSPFTVTALTFMALVDNDTSGNFSVTGQAGSSYGSDVTANVKDEISNVGLYNGSTLVGGLTNVSADGQINFAPISLVVAPGTTQTLTLRADVSNAFNLGQFNDRIKLAMYGVGGYGINADYSSAMNGNDADTGVIQTITE